MKTTKDLIAGVEFSSRAVYNSIIDTLVTRMYHGASGLEMTETYEALSESNEVIGLVLSTSPFAGQAANGTKFTLYAYAPLTHTDEMRQWCVRTLEMAVEARDDGSRAPSVGELGHTP